MESGIACSVPCCKNNQKETEAKGLKIEYHSFPDDVKEAAVWLNKMGKNVDIETSKICSQHFADDDYEVDITNRALGLPEKRILKTTAVPSRLLKIEWYKRTDKLLEKGKSPSKAKGGGKLTDAQRALKQLSMLQSAKKAPGPKASTDAKSKEGKKEKKTSPKKDQPKKTREPRAKTNEVKKKEKAPAKKGNAAGKKRRSPKKRKVSDISSEEEEDEWEAMDDSNDDDDYESKKETKGKVNGIKIRATRRNSSPAKDKAANKVITTRLSNKKISSKFKNCQTCLALLRDKRQLIAKIVALETELKHYIKQESNLELLKVVEKHEKGEIIVVKTEVTSESSDDDDSDDVLTAEPCEESDVVTVERGEDSEVTTAVQPTADDPNVMNVGHCEEDEEDSDPDASAEQVDDPDVMSGDQCEDDAMDVEHSSMHQPQ